MNVGPGDVLAGKYRVERVIGQGGMGQVVSAHHLQLDKLVALKLLLPEVAQNPDLVARFAREARAASKIQSEHVAKVLDVGALDDGTPFMVMEFLEGGDLAELVKTRGPLLGQDMIEYVLQASEALAEAHAAGIVHRDLKPANLFLTTRPDGSPSIKLLDFGISKIALAGEAGITKTQAVMGSPNYMAPEQLKSSRNVDARTDIWALGVLMHELLTGEVAFKAETVPELYVSILQDPPTPLRLRRPDAPPGVEAILARCLEKDPARRFQNMAELCNALAEFAPPRARLYVERVQRIVGAGAASPGSAPRAFSSPVAAAFIGHGGGSAPVAPLVQLGAPPGYGSYATPSHGAAYATPSHGAAYATATPPTAKKGLSGAMIALIVVVSVVVLGGGTCTMCLCIGAASQPASTAPGRR